MAALRMEIFGRVYNLHNCTNGYTVQNGLMESLSDRAQRFVILRGEGTSEPHCVADIVGEKCNCSDSKGRLLKESYSFVSWNEKIECPADKMAIDNAVEFLNSQNYKG